MILASLRLFLIVVWIAMWCLPIWLAKQLRKLERRDRMTMLCYRGLLRLAGIKLTVHGALAHNRPLLLASNHLSYLDIVLLGAYAPLKFTPKSEVADWPLIGSICRLCDAIFVDRSAGGMRAVKEALKVALTRGEVIGLFPEATTGDGLHLNPFKSGFFSLAEEAGDLAVQPVAITYTRIRRLPIDRTQWPSIAWYGDMTLMPHLFALLKLGSIDAELTFMPPFTSQEVGGRKEMAARARHDIAGAISVIRERRIPKAKSGYMPKIARFFGNSGKN